MALPLIAVQTQDGYVDDCTIELPGPPSPGGSYSIQGADVYGQLKIGPSPTQAQWADEIPIRAQAGGVGQVSAGAYGVRFRSFTAGVSAVVDCYLAEPGQPAFTGSSSGASGSKPLPSYVALDHTVEVNGGGFVNVAGIPQDGGVWVLRNLQLVGNLYNIDTTDGVFYCNLAFERGILNEGGGTARKLVNGQWFVPKPATQYASHVIPVQLASPDSIMFQAGDTGTPNHLQLTWVRGGTSGRNGDQRLEAGISGLLWPL